jgi:exosortase
MINLRRYPLLGSAAAAAVTYLLLVIVGYWFVLSSLARQWVSDSNYTHGLFILPMALILAWRRRDRFRAHKSQPCSLGLLFLFGGGVLYLLGITAAELFTTRFSLLMVILGIVLVLQGRARTKVLLFPCLFLLFMIPVPYIFYYKLTFPLQLKSSEITSGVLSILGMPAARSGNIIDLENYSLEVVTACSGLRSIMTLGALAVFVTDFFDPRPLARSILVFLAVPIAMLCNIVRLVVTAAIFGLAGAETADHFLHETSGMVVFMLGTLLLLITGGLIQWIGNQISK